MTARWITADVFDGLATLKDHSVDLVVTSPPFLALRSYLPADHELKSKEIGSESTPAEFIDTMLRVTAELRRVLAPHGSICVELGDTYAGSGGAGGDYNEDGLRDGQPKFRINRGVWREGQGPKNAVQHVMNDGGPGWPLAKSRTLIPSLYQIALAYGFNPLTGIESPAGQWRIRNIVTWARPNPPVGALGDKWRPATSDLIVACTSPKRYWDDLATRRPLAPKTLTVSNGLQPSAKNSEPPTASHRMDRLNDEERGAPLLDYWVIPPGGYTGAHYAVFPEELVVPCVKAMCPPKVCRTCGEPSRRIVESERFQVGLSDDKIKGPLGNNASGKEGVYWTKGRTERVDLGWIDCGHDDYRPGLVLDPFAGSGTTLSVATGHGRDAIGIDIDDRNAELARNRVGPFLFEMVTV